RGNMILKREPLRAATPPKSDGANVRFGFGAHLGPVERVLTNVPSMLGTVTIPRPNRSAGRLDSHRPPGAAAVENCRSRAALELVRSTSDESRRGHIVSEPLDGRL